MSAIRYQGCPACGAVWSLPRPLCPACGGAPEGREASGRGTVWSVTEVHRAAPPAFADRMPYALALVELAEGPRVLARAPRGLAVGEAVVGAAETVETAEGPRDLPVFRRA